MLMKSTPGGTPARGGFWKGLFNAKLLNCFFADLVLSRTILLFLSAAQVYYEKHHTHGVNFNIIL